MQAMKWLLRRGHCRNTHHRFALDAIDYVQTEPGKRLARILLRYHRDYLTGATDPDTRICDHHNQIIHVEDGYWGGATRVARQWYHRLQTRLVHGRYREAAQAAGILSHYFTDVLQPLHTGSTPREALVHRPLERSVYESYDEIAKIWIENDWRIVFQIGNDSEWLASAMKQAAQIAHQRFNLLVGSYRFDEGIRDAKAGLDPSSRAAVAQLFGLAITGWARIIERAGSEAETVMRNSLPRVSKSWPTMTAAAWAPRWRWRARVERCMEQQKIEALAKEYERKGELQKHLPDEVDIKQRVIQVRKDEAIYKIENARRAAEKLAALQTDDNKVQVAQHTITPSALIGNSGQYSFGSSIMVAPSIGKRTKRQIRELGIQTLGQFVGANAAHIAAQLGVFWIDDWLVRRWQRQSALMCQIAELRCVDAQLLIGAQIDSTAALAQTDPETVHREILRYAQTYPGQRYLQNEPLPTLESIRLWIARVNDAGDQKQAS